MRLKKYSPIAFSSILLLQTVPALAQKSDEEELSAVYGDKTTVSIATGNAQTLRRAPAVATVITAEEIAAIGAYEIDDVLASVPGFYVSKEAALYSSKYSIRGVGITNAPVSPQILFLVNGIPKSTLFSGDNGQSFRGYGIQQIARIEIIRGPGSALYGADAYAGVVNIVTKTASDTLGTEMGLHFGNQHTKQLWMQSSGKYGSFDVTAFLNISRSDGISKVIEADAATRNDSIFKTKSSLAPGKINSGGDSLDLGLDINYENFRFTYLQNIRANLGTGVGVSSALDPTSKAQSDRILFSLNWTNKNFAKDVALGYTASYLNSSDVVPNGIILLPPGTRLPTGLFPDGVIGGPSRWERQLRFSAYLNYSGFKDHQIRIGMGHDDLDLYRASTFKNFISNAAGTPVPNGMVQDLSGIQPHILPSRRLVNYFYIQDEWAISENLALTAGVRHDKYSDFGRTTNPRLALVWDASQNVTTKLLFGRAFRAPSFNETYGINVVANGNRKLAPETISTIEFATSWQASDSLQMSANLFRFERKNIISAVTNIAPAPGATYQNTGDQNGKGIEFELSWDYSRSFKIVGNYSYQKTVDSKLNKDVGYAPHHRLYGRADWRFANGWALSSQLNWVADRIRPAGDIRKEISDYKLVDLTLRTTRGIKKWDLTVSIRNIFNTDARDPSVGPGLAIPNDLPLAGRSFFIQAVYKM